MTELNNRIVVGKLGSCYGIKGWLRVNSYTEQADNIFEYQPWYKRQGTSWSRLEIESWRLHNQDYIVKFKQIEDRDAAALLVNQEIFIDSDCLPKLSQGDYYWKDLMGCQVMTLKGYCLGQVVDLMETGSNDVLVVKAQSNDAYNMKERLIPLIEDSVIKKIELENRYIEVEWDPAF